MEDDLNYAPCGFLSFRDDGTIISSNNTLQELLGFTEKELRGKNIELILPIASRIFYNTHLFPLIRLDKKANEIFLNLLSKDKNDVPVLLNFKRKKPDENISVFIPVYQRKKYEDEILTARKNAEETLKKNDELIRLKEQLENKSFELDNKIFRLQSLNENIINFNKIISHDFQEPLRKINVYSDILLESIEDNLDSKSRSYLERILKSVNRLRQLTKALELYLTIGNEINDQLVDLNLIMESAKVKLITEMNFDDFELLNSGLPSIKANAKQIELLFFHLLKNSVIYRNENKKLIIHVKGIDVQENIFRSTEEKYKFEDYVRISISDNGIGFDEKFTGYIFKLLNKIDLKKGGIGMGLALSKKIVENHLGKIEIRSEVGMGTEVRILLPTFLSNQK